MSERFYVNLPLCPGPFLLDGPEAHHLAAVCRLRPGDEVCLFNGDGHEYPARITHVARREITLEILRSAAPQRELPFTLEVAAPLPKGDRSQFLIEKLTELGVTTFVPLKCGFSNTHPRETKRDKLERHVIEGCKQCGRNVLMRIEGLTDWASYCTRGKPDELRVLAHPGQAEDLASFWRAASVSDQRRVIAVGPEGGFTAAEVALAIQHGWQAVSLGPRILRVETAAIVIAAAACV
ncbi:MAG: 16S rRNA (uracil(1498)-N(3))-methyltransferase [Gemmataceae bacterium]|nr:16S rRNA (uracil(1498)-N(3))-methyltransferase [Gemmataceae bacterium]